jgi:hypothetical protein
VTAVYDWEFTVTEPPFDLWSLQGQVPPPFESHAEKRWSRRTRRRLLAGGEAAGQLALSPGTVGGAW